MSTLPRRKPIGRHKSPIKRRSEKQRHLQELDGLVREKIFLRDGHRCLKCGGQGALTPSHILPKGRYPHLRFEETNILTLCWPCHRYWWHDSPLDAMEWLQVKFPGRMQMLREMDATAPKLDVKLLLTVYRREAVNR